MKLSTFMVGATTLLILTVPSVHGADKKAAGTVHKDKATGMELVRIEGGCYKMGDTFGDGSVDEQPVHEVCVEGFYMGKYEVTQKQWQAVMGDNPSAHTSCGADCPVDSVSWNDAQEFIAQLNVKSRATYRLPTEAEWEYAARSGGRQEKFPGGENPDELAWYDRTSENTTHKVGQKRPNGLGLYDLAGNVAEWCEDWYGEESYAHSPKKSPRGPESGNESVLRGGAFNYGATHVRSVNRNKDKADSRAEEYGLRLVLSAP